MSYLNTEESVFEKVASEKKTAQHDCVCVSRKEVVDGNYIFYSLWSGLIGDFINPKEFPDSIEYTVYVKMNGQWYSFDWWFWYSIRHSTMKLQEALTLIVQGKMPTELIVQKYAKKEEGK